MNYKYNDQTCFAIKGTKASGSKITCPTSQSWEVADLGIPPQASLNLYAVPPVFILATQLRWHGQGNSVPKKLYSMLVIEVALHLPVFSPTCKSHFHSQLSFLRVPRCSWIKQARHIVSVLGEFAILALLGIRASFFFFFFGVVGTS